MRNRRISRKGSLLLIAIGLMLFVSFMTTNQLDTLKLYFGVKRMQDLQQISDVAARSGIDYGYAMIKNVMESMSLNEVRFATHMHSGIGEGAVAEVPPYWQEIINHKFDRDAYQALNDSRNKTIVTSRTDGNWVGTDSYDVGALAKDIAFPFDQCNASIGNYDSSTDLLRSELLNEVGSFQSASPKKGDKTITTVENPPEDRDLREQGLGYAEKSEADTSEDAGIGDKVRTSLDCVYKDVTQPMETLVECAQETLSVKKGGNDVVTTYTLFDADLMLNKECNRQNEVYSEPWINIRTSSKPEGFPYLKREQDYVLDGHLGTKRWHYYDAWDFTNGGTTTDNRVNVKSDIDPDNPRGTGGMIRKDPQNLDGGATYFDTHRHILWERLFNYVRDSETLRFPYEPIDVTKSEPHERDASKNAYNVELYSVLDLTDLTLDDSAPEYDADLIDPTNYSAIKHKVFFKLWVTRDEGRDQYGTASEPGTVVTTFLSNDGKPFPEIRDWIGTPLKDLTSNGKPLDITTEELAVDLHPIWSMKRDDGFVPNIHPDCGVVLPTPEICVYIAETSLFRPNYLTDFLNWDGYERDDDKPDRLGVLSFPVPYLAIQRGDYDIWFGKYRTEKDILNKNGEVVHVKDTEVSIRGSEKATSTIPTEHPSYTKFTLWSLGTVREVNHELLQKSEDSRFSPYPLIAESKQKISDFKIVARTLYRMDFYMDVRAADITDEEAYRLDTDIDQQEVDICVTPDDKKHRNLNNQAYYNALKVSVCDLSADESVKTVFEPMGIISESQQKWPYRDSKKE